MTIRNEKSVFAIQSETFKIYYQIFVEIELRYPKTRWVVDL